MLLQIADTMPNPKPSIPYPSRRNDERRRENADEQKEKFYEIFKDISFEISFMDALTLMPKFLIPCKFPGMDECLVLADLGASINLMPFSVWKKLNLPDLTPTCMTLELADHSISRPIGIAKDVNVKVGVFQFPADFVTSRYSVNYNDMTANRIDVVELACKEYSQEVLGFSDMIASGNPTPGYDPIVSNFLVDSPSLCGIKETLLFSKTSLIVDPSPLRSKEIICREIRKPFELMCDASDYAIGAVMGQRIEKHFRPIHYASKTMTEAESNYTTTEKEMLAVFIFAKKDAKARLLRWALLLQEFDFKVIDTKGAKNYAADHLSRLENPYENVLDPKEINKKFPLETLNMVTLVVNQVTPWVADYANYTRGISYVKGIDQASGDVFQGQKLSTSSRLPLVDHQGDMYGYCKNLKNKWFKSGQTRNWNGRAHKSQANAIAKEVIENGNSWVPILETTPPESGTSTTIKMIVPATIEEKTCKKNDVKARTRFGAMKQHRKDTEGSVETNSMCGYPLEDLNLMASNKFPEDLEQLHDDDLEEMDLKWNMALLSMRARKLYQRTGRKIIIDGSNTAGYDKSKERVSGHTRLSMAFSDTDDDEDEVESHEKKTYIPTTAKIEKPVRKQVKYAEMYRSQRPRGKQRNWNGQKSN
ncbi:reverse transcriptase domain-containing protein [Tanacetum coccineum]|uniref:Reverse transcriptase domain-containing protein n=1 Tax=Tanacetum coccineum TaxID=301880 RepID=A0ABQ4Y851_9ASTR